MTRWTIALCVALMASAPLPAAEPDYSQWNRILGSYYAPDRGMDYAGLKARELGALNKLRHTLSKVDVASLTRDEQLAFWMNLYNVSVVSIATEGYPVESIRDLSTDPIVRLNVFKKPSVPFGSGSMSLDDIEHTKIREGFRDPRIHFAINCAARSCPPIRPEAFTGARVSAQLDEQVRAFVNGPRGVKLERNGKKLTIHTTKIMDWFGEDFEKWGGGAIPFLRRYLTPDKATQIAAAGDAVKLEFQDYDWALNDWPR